MEDRTAEAYLVKAEESLASAESDFVAGRYNGCANRTYYACFQAGIAALLREGIRPTGRDGQWGHEFVESRFVGQLVNRRHRYPAELRSVLSDNRDLRQKGDYRPAPVIRGEAARSLRRGHRFFDAVRAGEGKRGE